MVPPIGSTGRCEALFQCLQAHMLCSTPRSPSESAHSLDPLLEAMRLLQQLNTMHRRILPTEAPTNFVSMKWRPYVVNPDGRIDRHYYELCTLWELHGALRAGNVWVANSRRYADPETYLIPKDRWPALRPEVCQQVHAPEHGVVRLEECRRELVELFSHVD